MARKAKKVEPKPEDENADQVAPAEQPAAEKDVPENFDQYRAKH